MAILNFHSACTPCKLIAPHLEALRKSHSIAVCNISVDRADDLATKFDVRAIPTFILIKKVAG